MKIFYFFSVLIISISFKIYAQCNGSELLCSKKYNEVSYLTTHNAYNSAEDSFFLPNQNYSIKTQLKAGVRALMVDVYDDNGLAIVCHGFKEFGVITFNEVLSDIKTFLDLNPNEIVTLILESYVTVNQIKSSLNELNLLGYLYAHQIGEDWPVLQELIDRNTRLIIFSDVDDTDNELSGYHYLWDHAIETHYANSTTSDLSCNFNRGKFNNDLFILNHFLNDSLLGTGVQEETEFMNTNPFFMNRVLECMYESNKFPNFITVDFFDLGESLAVVNKINGVSENNPTSDYLLYPNPLLDRVIIRSDKVIKRDELKVFNALGQDCTETIEFKNLSENMSLDLSRLSMGPYFLSIGKKNYTLIKR